MNPDFTPIVRALQNLAAIERKGAWDYISTSAVVLTLIVLIKYTIETSRLRRAAQQQTTETRNLLREAQQQNSTSLSLVTEAHRQTELYSNLWNEAQRQNEFSVMPFLAIFLDLPEALTNSQVFRHTKPQLKLRNVGKGPAFNVVFDKYSAEGKVLELTTSRAVLTPGEERAVQIHFEAEPNHGTEGNADVLYEWINTERLPDPHKVRVRCRSVISVDCRFDFGFTPNAGRLGVIYQGFESSRSMEPSPKS